MTHGALRLRPAQVEVKGRWHGVAAAVNINVSRIGVTTVCGAKAVNPPFRTGGYAAVEPDECGACLALPPSLWPA